MAVQGNEASRFDTVRIDETGVAELDGDRPIVSIEWTQLRALELTRGAGAERPWVVAAIGSGLVMAGLYFLFGLLRFLAYGGRYHTAGAWLIALGGLGAMMLWSLRPKYMLVARTDGGKRRLIFQHCQDREAIERFIAAATSGRWPRDPVD